MNKKELAPGIVLYKDIFNGYQTLISDIENAVDSKITSWSQASVVEKNFDGINTESRDTLSLIVPHLNNLSPNLSIPPNSFNYNLSKIFFKVFDPFERDYMFMYNVWAPTHDQYSILKYGVGQKFINHIDDCQDYHRRISTVYYVNDDYVGGEIEFPRFNISYKPKANELLIFPSTYVYNHSVNRVIEGTRYSIVSWLK
jgi:hypothetical protein